MTSSVFDGANHPLLSSWVLMCFTINVIMGSGFLGVPYGFLFTGTLLGGLVLLSVSILQWMAACILAQVATRAHAILADENASALLTPALVPLAKAEAGFRHLKAVPLSLPSHTSYEIPMLCRLFLGRWTERIVMASVALYQVGSLWSYVNVFAASMTAIIPIPGLLGEALLSGPCDIYKTDAFSGACITLYYFWALGFAVLMAALLGLDMREQACFQCFMTFLRAAIIIVMCCTLVFGDRSDFGLPASDNATSHKHSPSLVHWGGLPKIVLISVFCQ